MTADTFCSCCGRARSLYLVEGHNPECMWHEDFEELMKSRDEFVKNYVSSFLASWAAIERQEAHSGWQRHTVEHAPVEDAFFQAKKTWNKCLELKPDFFKGEPFE